MSRSWPAWLTLALAIAYVLYRLLAVGGAPEQLAGIGSRFSEGRPGGTEGYDGQFVLYMALDPRPRQVVDKLDVPAYRYQRILLPMLARALALGRGDWIPWALIAVNLVAHFYGTLAICLLLARRELWVGFALLYGLWAGTLGGVGAMLHEPLAYGLVAGAAYSHERGRDPWALILLALALFTKETTALFVAGFALADVFDRRDRRLWLGYGLITVAFLLWQGWLWETFGAPGLGSGGAGATSFEWIPLMGLIRVGFVHLRLLLIYLFLFGPGVLAPSLWGLWQARTSLLQDRGDARAWNLGINAAVILFLPFSTFREPFGLVRVATGLMLAFLLYLIERGQRRPLVYACFWLAYLALIL